MFPPNTLRVPKNMTPSEQIKKFRTLCGQNLHAAGLKLQVYTLVKEIVDKEIPNSAQLGELYTAGELRAVGAWWMDPIFVLEIANFYLMNVILTCAETVNLDKARHKNQVMAMMGMYAPRASIAAEALVPILIREFGEGEYDDAAAEVCQARREQYLASMNPKVLEEANTLAEKLTNVNRLSQPSQSAGLALQA